jgi:hypothetical protein
MDATSCGSVVGGSQVVSNIRTIAFVEASCLLLGDFRPVYVGAYGIQSDTRLRIPHLGFQKCVDESSHHLTERSTVLLPAHEFDGFGHLGEVPF